MRKFTRIVAPAMMAALGLGKVAQADAQPMQRHNAGRPTPVRDANVRADINGLRAAIDRAAARRTISQREAAGLRRDAAQVQRLYASYSRNGLTMAETRTLKARVDRIRASLHMERTDWDRRRG